MGALVNEQRKKMLIRCRIHAFAFYFFFRLSSQKHTHTKRNSLYTGYLYRLGAARSYPIYFMPVCVSVCIHLFV